MNQIDTQQWENWIRAAQLPLVHEQLTMLYERLASDIDKHQPVCVASGKCCHFETYGHRLYVTGLEIGWMYSQLSDSQKQALLDSNDLLTLDGCPFQLDGKCSVHPIRPLGCRIYYCDPNAQAWQNPAYELYLADLQTMHELNQIEYAYLEWRKGLSEIKAICGNN